MNTTKSRKVKPKDVLSKASQSINKNNHKEEYDIEVHKTATIGNLRQWDFPQAMREIIDNPIDAQAENIHVKFPSKIGRKSEVEQGTPIMVLDDGCGMTLDELVSAVKGVGCGVTQKGNSDAGIFHIGLKGSIASLGEMGIVFSKCPDTNTWSACQLIVDTLKVIPILKNGSFEDLLNTLSTFKINGNLKQVSNWFNYYESGTGVLIFQPKGEHPHITWHTDTDYPKLISSVKRTITQIYSLRLKSDTNLKIDVEKDNNIQRFAHDEDGVQDIFYEGMKDPSGELDGTMMSEKTIQVTGVSKDGTMGKYPMTVKGYFLPDHKVLENNSQNLFGTDKLPSICFDQKNYGGKKTGAWGLYLFTNNIMINDKPVVGNFFGWEYWYPRVRFQVHISKEHIPLYVNWGNKSKTRIDDDSNAPRLKPLYETVNEIVDGFKEEVNKLGRKKPLIKRISQEVLNRVINKLSDKLHQKGLLNVEYDVEKNVITTGDSNGNTSPVTLGGKGNRIPYGTENPESNSLVVVKRRKKKKKNDFNIVEEALVDTIPFTWEVRKGVTTFVLNTESHWYKSVTAKINSLASRSSESVKDDYWEMYIEQIVVDTISAFRHRLNPSGYHNTDLPIESREVLDAHIGMMYDMYTMYDK